MLAAIQFTCFLYSRVLLEILQPTNLTVEWLELLLHLREIGSSVFGKKRTVSWCFRGLHQSLQENAGITL